MLWPKKNSLFPLKSREFLRARSSLFNDARGSPSLKTAWIQKSRMLQNFHRFLLLSVDFWWFFGLRLHPCLSWLLSDDDIVERKNKFRVSNTHFSSPNISLFIQTQRSVGNVQKIFYENMKTWSHRGLKDCCEHFSRWSLYWRVFRRM